MNRHLADRQRSFSLVGLTFGGIFLDGHPAAPLGLLVPAFWIDSPGHGEQQLAIVALAALLAGIASMWSERSGRRAQALQAVSVICFSVSAFIAFRITGFLALTLASAMPFAGALFAYLLFSFDRRTSSEE